VVVATVAVVEASRGILIEIIIKIFGYRLPSPGNLPGL
jgi:hypothetical protein